MKMKRISFKVKHPKFDRLLDVTSIEIKRKYVCVDYSEEDVLHFIADNDLGTIPLKDVELFLVDNSIDDTDDFKEKVELR